MTHGLSGPLPPAPVTVFRYGVQVGPRTVALAAWASKGLGLPAGKVARLLGQLGVTITRVG